MICFVAKHIEINDVAGSNVRLGYPSDRHSAWYLSSR